MRRSDLEIPLPCTADWDTMTRHGKKRFCADCKKFVHDLSAMRETEVEALLASSKDLCVRYVYDAVGDLVFDIDRPLVPATTLNRAKRAAAAALMVALPMQLTACMGAPPRATMGAPLARPVAPDDAGAPAADGGPDGGAPVAK